MVHMYYTMWHLLARTANRNDSGNIYHLIYTHDQRCITIDRMHHLIFIAAVVVVVVVVFVVAARLHHVRKFMWYTQTQTAVAADGCGYFTRLRAHLHTHDSCVRVVVVVGVIVADLPAVCKCAKSK